MIFLLSPWLYCLSIFVLFREGKQSLIKTHKFFKYSHVLLLIDGNLSTLDRFIDDFHQKFSKSLWIIIIVIFIVIDVFVDTDSTIHDKIELLILPSINISNHLFHSSSCACRRCKRIMSWKLTQYFSKVLINRAN